jgi:hypothetical protein
MVTAGVKPSVFVVLTGVPIRAIILREPLPQRAPNVAIFETTDTDYAHDLLMFLPHAVCVGEGSLDADTTHRYRREAAYVASLLQRKDST